MPAKYTGYYRELVSDHGQPVREANGKQKGKGFGKTLAA
jgi:hypothetical protein